MPGFSETTFVRLEIETSRMGFDDDDGEAQVRKLIAAIEEACVRLDWDPPDIEEVTA